MSKFTIMFMLSAVCCSADITYDVDQTVGIGSVKGFIETDGTTGVLGASNILNWNLLLNDSSTTFDLTGPLSGNDSTLTILDGPLSSDLTASSTQLTFNFADTGDGFVLFQETTGSPLPYWCIESSIACTGQPAGEDLAITNADIGNLMTSNTFTAISSAAVIANVAQITTDAPPPPADGLSVAPEPSTISFLGLGFAALGFWKYRAARAK